MKILVLTSESHHEFVDDMVSALDTGTHNWLISADSKYKFPSIYDIGISFMYQQKIPKEQLSKTWFNFHPGPLPKYRGRNLCYHALMNGEEYFGVSIHYMDEYFDTGDIIDVWTFPILGFDTAESISSEAMRLSRHLFEEYLPRITSGETFKRVENRGGTYHKKEPINDVLDIPDYLKREIRAITYGKFYPKIMIGGDTYKIVKEQR